MCAEAVWWRCHRRIVADHLIARGIEVRHIMSKTSAPEATLTPFAKIVRGRVHYPDRMRGRAPPLLPAVLAIAYAVAVVARGVARARQGLPGVPRPADRPRRARRAARRRGDRAHRRCAGDEHARLLRFACSTRAPGETVRDRTRERDESRSRWRIAAAVVRASSRRCSRPCCSAPASSRGARGPSDAACAALLPDGVHLRDRIRRRASWPRLIVHPVLATGFLCALFAGPGVSLSISRSSYGDGGRGAQRVLLACRRAARCDVRGGRSCVGVRDAASDGGARDASSRASRRRSRCCRCTRASGCGPSCARIARRPARRRRSCAGCCSGTRSARCRSSRRCRSRSPISIGS